ncbi:hypothetical protein BDN70DRAFT_887459 [Pholiota conissans]|uniref:Macrofage activating glycoprotein n=1 Tax=Pholiota conissans TaxID=109636 RepID=A0A9P6CMQ6_9AGAR|nr:hypothetical protein BDN70DRAFT_887459 [Pholiota conissans]
MLSKAARLLSVGVLLGGLASSVYAIDASASAEGPQITPPPTRTVPGELERRQQAGASGTPILSTLHFAFTDLPFQVYPFQVLRGPQFGFNICNSTTLGAGSNCQTLIFNGPDDFCLWGSPDPNGLIGNVEAKVVAYCTKPTHGSRLIPPGAITGLQWMKTSAYIQVTGFINNTALSLDPTDAGGELDPHGADLQGNPLGGVVFSNGTADSDGHTLTQVFNWNNFVGSGQFCFKACFNSIPSPDYCENRYDLVGCDYNMPSAAQDGEFTSCEGELQDVVGVYTTNGQVITWSMPDPLVTPPPYQPRVPASSNCQTFQSSDLFLAATTTSASVTSTSSGGTGSGAGTGSKSGSGTGTGTGSPSPTTTSGAIRDVPSGIAFMMVGLAGLAMMF